MRTGRRRSRFLLLIVAGAGVSTACSSTGAMNGLVPGPDASSAADEGGGASEASLDVTESSEDGPADAPSDGIGHDTATATDGPQDASLSD